jgi:hypothetical protein
LLLDYRINWKKNSLFCSSLLLMVFFIFSLFSIASAQYTTNSQPAQGLEPLDIGNPLKIKCFSGSFVEFVSDCPIPNSCNSLRMENGTLICSNSEAGN